MASTPAWRRVAGAESRLEERACPGLQAFPVPGDSPPELCPSSPAVPPHDPLQGGPQAPLLCKPQLNSAPPPNLPPPRAPLGVRGWHLGLSLPLLLIPLGLLPERSPVRACHLPASSTLGRLGGGAWDLCPSPHGSPSCLSTRGLQASGLPPELYPPPWPPTPAQLSDPSFRPPSPGRCVCGGAPSRVSAWPLRLLSWGQGRLAQPGQARAPSARCCQGRQLEQRQGSGVGPSSCSHAHAPRLGHLELLCPTCHPPAPPVAQSSAPTSLHAPPTPDQLAAPAMTRDSQPLGSATPADPSQRPGPGPCIARR